MKEVKYKFGDIYKHVTGEKKIPKSTEQIWKTVSKGKKIKEGNIVTRLGSNVTSSGGNVFKVTPVSIDIDKYI